jgi:segregation and condensation protein B
MQDLEQKHDAATDAAEIADRQETEKAETMDSAPERPGSGEIQESLELGTYISPDDVVEDPAPNIDEAAGSETWGSGERLSGAAMDEAGDEQSTIIFEQAIESPVDEESQSRLKATIEAAIYITDEPLTPEQIARAVEEPVEVVKQILAKLTEEYARPDRGLSVRELAGGYKMGTKPEHHESIRLFVKRLQPPFKLSLAALETLAVVAYKQPITAPEIMEIRGVQGAGVLKTLLDRRLIATAGRKDVVGRPIMYKTTKEFLIQFGLSSLGELPTLKEFEELGRMAMTDETSEFEGPSSAEEGRIVNTMEAREAEQPEPLDADLFATEAAVIPEGNHDAELPVETKQSDNAGEVMENTEGHSVELPQGTPPMTGSKEDEV